MDYSEKTTKKGNARKGKPVRSRLAFEDNKQEAEKARKSTGKMSDVQKTALSKHMVKMEKGGMGKSEMKSHRMKLMGRMRKGMSVASAHKDVMKA